MEKVILAVPERFAAEKEMPAVLRGEAADLYVFPEGFLRSREELAMALELTQGLGGTVLTGFRDGDEEKVLAIEGGQVAGMYTKCILTGGEKAKGKRPGERIHCVRTRLGKIAAPICYELHFPEVCRILALEKPALLVNPIGTGMYHRQQYDQWRALARARAIENELPVVGCCHFCGEIPLAFAFSSAGEPLLEARGRHGAFAVEIDFTEGHKRPTGYWNDRRPALFSPLSGGALT